MDARETEQHGAPAAAATWGQRIGDPNEHK